MRNFLAGLLLGVCGTYWWLTQATQTRGLIAGWWERASSPPARSAPAAPRR